jgi:peptide/nickel transport system ATP-binding protein
VPDPALERAKSGGGLGGELPSAIDPPSGCHFRTRCPLATDRCAEEVPVLQSTAGRHAVACHHPLAGGAFPAPVAVGGHHQEGLS